MSMFVNFDLKIIKDLNYLFNPTKYLIEKLEIFRFNKKMSEIQTTN